MIPRSTLEEASALCAEHGVWLVLDNTYEHFEYAGCPVHECLEGDHIINVFSFSKAFGMMGWRVGYLAFPPTLMGELFKVQDTIAICPTQVSQHVAVGASQAGRAWVTDKVAGLAEQKALVLDALKPLGDGAVQGGSGAIYLFCRLPPSCQDDMAVVKYLVDEHGVVLIPGSACGVPGSVRVCYANLPLEKTRVAADRLRAGLTALVSGVVDLKAYAAQSSDSGDASPAKRPRPSA